MSTFTFTFTFNPKKYKEFTDEYGVCFYELP